MYFLLLNCTILLSQKKTNGKIYIEHPALEIVNQFNDAFVKGDLEKIKSLVTENFSNKYGQKVSSQKAWDSN